MTRIALDQLDNLQVASPCPMTWDALDGDDPHVRHCGDCDMHVYNIASLTREQIADLIESHEGERLCGVLHRRADGTLITADCPVGLAAIRRKAARTARWIAACIGGVLVGGLALDGVARGDHGTTRSLRNIEPFATLMDLFKPAPPPITGQVVPTNISPTPVTIQQQQQQMIMGRMIAGEICLPNGGDDDDAVDAASDE